MLSRGSNVDAYSFLKKRLGKVLGPTLVWTLVYLLVRYVQGEMSLSAVGVSLLNLPFAAQGHGVLWFMYTLVGLYLLAPILQSWLRTATEREVRLYLLLWGVSLCYPLIGLFLKVETSVTGVLYYVSGYAGYFLLGYYLKHYGLPLRFRTVALSFVLAALAPVVVKVMHWEVDFYSLFWYLSIFVAVQCIFWWQLIHRVMVKVGGLKGGMVSFLVMISNLSFGIYLSHILVMRVGLWNMDFILGIPSYVCQTVAIALLTLVVATTISYVISKLPIGNVFIGYRSKH